MEETYGNYITDVPSSDGGSWFGGGTSKFLGDLLKNGVSRIVDAEIDNNFGLNDTPPAFSDERTGQTFRAGQPAPAADIRAPAVGVTAPRLGGNNMLLIAGAVGLVVLLLVLRK